MTSHRTSTITKPTPRTPSHNRTRNSTITNSAGLFSKGVWHCDCQPRIPAEHFQVKKESKNRGRWFYTCQKAEPARCGFFLWEDDAQVRMKEAVLGNSRSEPKFGGSLRQTELKEQLGKREREVDGMRKEGQTTPPRKRKLPWRDGDIASPAPVKKQPHTSKPIVAVDEAETEDEEDTFDWPLTGEEETALTASATAAAAVSPETPRKAIKLSDTDTPQRATTNLQNGLPTPGTTPHANKTSHLNQPAAQTPTASRFIDALKPPPDGQRLPEDASATLTSDVMELVSSFKPTLHSDQLESLRALLDKHSWRYQGVVRGRDKTRQAVSNRDAKIIKMQQQIAGLQGEVESGKTLVKHLRMKLEDEIARQKRPKLV